MSSTIKNAPTDRIIKVLRFLLICIGLAAMGTVMWMTGRFGWSLQEADADRWASAILHVLGDAAGGGLIAISAIMLGWVGWRWRTMGLIALLCALTLVAYSIVSVYGFMSTRIAHLESHKNVVAFERGDLDWKRKTSVSREVPKGERILMRKDAQSATEQLKKSLSFIPDAQAAGIAAWMGTTTERVQRGLVVITSCVGQLIKVSCLFFGFSLWSHRQHDAASSALDTGSDASGGRGGGGRKLRVVSDADDAGDAAKKIPAKSAIQAASPQYSTTQRSVPDVSLPGAKKPKMSDEELHDYLHQHASGDLPRKTQRQQALDTGWSQPSVCRKSRQVRRQEARAARKAARRDAHQNGYAGFGGGGLHAPAAV